MILFSEHINDGDAFINFECQVSMAVFIGGAIGSPMTPTEYRRIQGNYLGPIVLRKLV